MGVFQKGKCGPNSYVLELKWEGRMREVGRWRLWILRRLD